MPNIETIIGKVICCSHVEELLQLEPQLNSVGLTAQNTNNKVLVCKVINGRPSAKVLFEDYVVAGHWSGNINV